MTQKILHKLSINTPLGQMIALADDKSLYLLEFTQRKALNREIERLLNTLGASITEGRTETLDLIEKEISLYFEGKLTQFKTPLALTGTPFQKLVWKELIKIPFGQTKSYRDLALAIDKPTAARAVAMANATNQLALIIPCHRVINASGKLGGYAAGVDRKQWLLDHEHGALV